MEVYVVFKTSVLGNNLTHQTSFCEDDNMLLDLRQAVEGIITASDRGVVSLHCKVYFDDIESKPASFVVKATMDDIHGLYESGAINDQD